MIFILYICFLLFTIYPSPCESLKCYECTGHISCGEGQTGLMVDCAEKCMVYRNQDDQDIIVRRCCINDCGTEDGVRNYEGRNPAYFCSTDLCNELGSEEMLTGGTVSSSTTAEVTSEPITITTETTGLSSTQITTTISVQSSSQCYDCAGPDCGKEGSPLAMNCPSCMVYRNPKDQTIIERRCCRSACGSSFTVGIYNGVQTYFCSYDKCNRYGAETILNPPVTGTTIPSITTSTTMTTTTTYSPSICTLNCRNGGTLEKDNGCFCYCAAKTNGRECENIDCILPDDKDPGICLPENQSLCKQSEIFTYKCLHLCGKC